MSPDFTTKPQGKGTGLGLAMVYGIVKEHGGHIAVTSEEKRGATFTLFFPLAEDAVSPEAPPPMEGHATVGSGRILVVDDEDDILELMETLLERLGHRVTTRHNGAEALALFSADPAAFDLVISDLTMPAMTGDQLARKMIALRPDIPILICTGFSERVGTGELSNIGIQELLMKPITLSTLSEKIEKIFTPDRGAPPRLRQEEA